MRKVIVIVALLLGCTEEEFSDRAYPRYYPLQVENISRSSALFSVEIFYSSVQITNHGFVYSTTEFPNLDNGTKVSLGPAPGVGTYSYNIATLEQGKTYYVRAFAISPGHTTYSTGVKFKTTN